MLAKFTHDKIAKIAKITNVTTFKEETRKDPEMSANIATIAKVTGIFYAS